MLRHPILRKIAACTGTANLFGSMGIALEIVFLVRVLRIPPADTVFFSPLRGMRALEDQRAPGSGVPGQGGRELPDGAGPPLGD